MKRWLFFFLGGKKVLTPGTPVQLPARVAIYPYVDLPARAVVTRTASLDLPARVAIYPYVDLPARAVVTRTASLDLPARVGITIAVPPVDLPARVDILTVRDLPAAVRVQPYRDLPARVNVDELRVVSDLPALVNVINARSFLPARVYVLAASDLQAKVFIRHFDLPARVLIQREASLALDARVVVQQDAPDSVGPITASVPEATWQTQSEVDFSWLYPTWRTYPVMDYLWRVDRDPDATASAAWAVTTLRSASVDFDSPAYGGGVWYFHAAARNIAGFIGPTSHFEVRWNIPPGIPGLTFMKVDQLNTLISAPLISATAAHTLSWSPAEDSPGETLTYEVQVSSRPDFLADSETGLSSIVWDSANIPAAHTQLVQSLPAGLWFWRIRADDGKEVGGWSSVGGFRINARPGRPTGLKANQA